VPHKKRKIKVFHLRKLLTERNVVRCRRLGLVRIVESTL